MSPPHFRREKNHLDYGARAITFVSRNRAQTFDRADEARSKAPECQRREDAKRENPIKGSPVLGLRCFIGSVARSIIGAGSV